MSDGRILTHEYLENRAAHTIAAGWPCPKWITFATLMLDKGFDVRMYEARKTPSKYITVRKGDKKFKVRFSNHKPIHRREVEKDCDFFVGVTNLQVSNTRQAVVATCKFFGMEA